MKHISTLLIALGILALANVAQAAIITTVEWESKPAGAWSYTSGRPNIDCTVPASPSGGCALQFVYPAGTYSTSFGGGRAEYALSGQPRDIYFGAWMRYGPGFVFHPNGHKVNFFVWAGGGGLCRNIGTGYATGILNSAPQICWGPQTKNYFQNVGAWNKEAARGQWHWYEMRMKLNTPGQFDGIMQIWIDDVLYLSYSNIPMAPVEDTGGWVSLVHTAEYGGGGSTLATTQYWWVDHTVISTTRIGRPGSASGARDTTSPLPPVGVIIR